LKWLAIYTKIPVPRVLHHDASRNNELGYEYMLMTMTTGRSFEVIRKDLPVVYYQEHLDGFLDQVVEIISELDSHKW
jgi:hypothetical protein